jgi:hypothetical protein
MAEGSVPPVATFPPVDEILTRVRRITDRESMALALSRPGAPLAEWGAYAHKYRTYSLSLYRSRLEMLNAEHVLKEYPTKLPPEIRDPILGFERLLVGEQTTLGGYSAQAQPSPAARTSSTQGNTGIEETHSILVPSFGLMMFERGEEKKFDFSQTVYAKEVVMQVAYLNAFVQDTIAVICRLQPEVTKGAKQIADFFQATVNWFKQLGLDLKVVETQIKWLEEAGNVRDIIVHNGGKVDEQFLRRTGRKDDLTVGEPFPLSGPYLLRVYCGSKAFASTLFIEVGEKVFHFSFLRNLNRERS